MNPFENERYTSYDYKKIAIQQDIDMQYVDGITSFGWNIDDQKTTTNEQGIIHYVLRRNRNIINKTELIRLEKNFDFCFHEILRLKNSVKTKATLYASVVAVIGTAFVAGSTFAITNDPPIVSLCVLLAIPGFIGWILPYFVYKKTVVRQERNVEVYIKENYDEIEKVCEKARQIMQ